MKVGDLVRNNINYPSKVFLVMRVQQHADYNKVVWLYPDPDCNPNRDHTDEENYYFKHFFEVVSESR